jgi:hypothetical protein
MQWLWCVKYILWGIDMGRQHNYGAWLAGTAAVALLSFNVVVPAFGATPAATPTPVPELPPATLAECTTKSPTRTSWECVGVGATHKKEDRDPMMEAAKWVAGLGAAGVGITLLQELVKGQRRG